MDRFILHRCRQPLERKLCLLSGIEIQVLHRAKLFPTQPAHQAEGLVTIVAGVRHGLLSYTRNRQIDSNSSGLLKRNSVGWCPLNPVFRLRFCEGRYDEV